MTIRFCKQCNDTINTFLTEDGKNAVFRLAHLGIWLCPFSKKQCGTIINKQDKPNGKKIIENTNWRFIN